MEKVRSQAPGRRGPLAGALGAAMVLVTGCGTCDLAGYEAARHQARRAELDASMALADAERHLAGGRLELGSEVDAIEAAVEAAVEEREGIPTRVLEDEGVVRAVAAYDARVRAFTRDSIQAREAVSTSMRAAGALADEAARREGVRACDDQDFAEAYRRGDAVVGFSRRLRNLAEVPGAEPGLGIAEARLARLRREAAGSSGPSPGTTPVATGPAPALDRIDGYVIGRLYRFEGSVGAEAVVTEVPCTAPEELAAARATADDEAVRTLAGNLPRQRIDVRILAEAECYEVVRVVYRSDGPAARAALRRQVREELEAVAGEPLPGD